MVKYLENTGEGISEKSYSIPTYYELSSEQKRVFRDISKSLENELSKLTVIDCYSREDKLREKQILDRNTVTKNIKNILEDELAQTNIASLIYGSMNLINLVAKRFEDEKPIETLLFVDQSARNAYFIFNKLWEGLKQQQYLPENIGKPKIRFLNIDTDIIDRENTSPAIPLLKNKLHKNDYPNSESVLVVDEIIATGESARAAIKTLNDLYGINVDAISQLEIVPE